METELSLVALSSLWWGSDYDKRTALMLACAEGEILDFKVTNSVKTKVFVAL